MNHIAFHHLFISCIKRITGSDYLLKTLCSDVIRLSFQKIGDGQLIILVARNTKNIVYLTD